MMKERTTRTVGRLGLKNAAGDLETAGESESVTSPNVLCIDSRVKSSCQSIFVFRKEDDDDGEMRDLQ